MKPFNDPLHIASNIRLEDSGCKISSISIIPGKQFLAVVNQPCDISAVKAELETWDYDIVSAICEKYSYATKGQAFSLFDLLVHHGLVSFSDRQEVEALCNETIRTKWCIQNDCVPNQPSGSISGFLKQYASDAGLDYDQLLECFFTMELLDGVILAEKDGGVDICLTSKNAAPVSLLSLRYKDGEPVSMFTPEMILFLFDLADKPRTEAAVFMDCYGTYSIPEHGRPAFFWNPHARYNMDLDRLLDDWPAFEKAVASLIACLRS